MNYLAHLHLADVAGQDDEGTLGNLVADMVKGPEVERLTEGVQAGVRMHRKVDRYTDTHERVQSSIRRISADWGWFSGIVIDVYYDHLLAETWAEWSEESLRAFTLRMHGRLVRGLPHLPESAQFGVSKLVETDRLMMYATRDGIADTFVRLSDRIARRLPQRARRLEEAMPLLLQRHDELTVDFRAFYPALMAHVLSLREFRRESAPDSCATAGR